MIKEVLRKVTRSEKALPSVLTDYKPGVVLMSPPYFDLVVSDLLLRANKSSSNEDTEDAQVFLLHAAEEANVVFERIKPKGKREEKLRAAYAIELIKLYTDTNQTKKALALIGALRSDSSIPQDAIYLMASQEMVLLERL